MPHPSSSTPPPSPEPPPLSPPAIYLKAALFALILLLSSTLLLAPSPTISDLLRSALFLALALWSACRLYYFAFYVIEKYIDPTSRYSGLLDFLRRHLISRPRSPHRPPHRP